MTTKNEYMSQEFLVSLDETEKPELEVDVALALECSVLEVLDGSSLPNLYSGGWFLIDVRGRRLRADNLN
jgi:hypothetical protein